MEKIRFCQYVAKRRQALGKSQKLLAEELSYTPQAISRFESLNSGFPLEFIPKLCSSLDCSINDFFTRNLETPHYEAVEDDFLSRLQERLVNARLKDGRTQKQLSDSIGITERSLRKYEKGESYPSYQTLESLAEALKVDIVYFFKSENQPTSENVIPPEVIHAKRKFNWGFAALFGFLILALIGGSIAIPMAVNGASAYQPPANHGSAAASNPIATSSVQTTKVVPEELPLRYAFSQDKAAFENIGDSLTLNVDYEDQNGTLNVLQGDHVVKIDYPKEYESYLRMEYEVKDAHSIVLTLKNASRTFNVPLAITIDGESFDDVFHVRVPSFTPVKLFESDETPFYSTAIEQESSLPVSKNTPYFLNIDYYDQNGATLSYSDSSSVTYTLDFYSDTSYGTSQSKLIRSKKNSKSSSYFMIYTSSRSTIIFSYLGGLRRGVYVIFFYIPVYDGAGNEPYEYALDPVEITVEDEQNVSEFELDAIEIKGNFSSFSYEGEKREYELIDPDGAFDLSGEEYYSSLNIELKHFFEDSAHQNPFSLERISPNRFSIEVNGAWHGDGAAVKFAIDMKDFGAIDIAYYEDNNQTPFYTCYSDQPHQEFYDAYFVCASHPNLKARRGEVLLFDIYFVVNKDGETLNIKDQSYWTREIFGSFSYPKLPRLDHPLPGWINRSPQNHSFSYREGVNSPNENCVPWFGIGCYKDGIYNNFYVRPVTVQFID